MLSKMYSEERGFTLIELVLVMALAAVLMTGTAYGMLSYRNTFEYDLLLNQIVESINFARMKATKSQLNKSGERVEYGVKFFENRFVEFGGNSYVEGADENVENSVPVGLRLSTDCEVAANGEVSFSVIAGENANPCTIEIYRAEQGEAAGAVTIGKFGIEHAQ